MEGKRRYCLLTQLFIFFNSVECFPWYNTVNSPDCVKENLLKNDWIAPDAIKDLQKADAKFILINKLNSLLDSSIHTIPDLSLREVNSDYDGLCGLAATYKALYDTILTESELKTMNYDSMRSVILEELNVFDESLEDLIHQSDFELLRNYHKGKVLYVTN